MACAQPTPPDRERIGLLGRGCSDRSAETSAIGSTELAEVSVEPLTSKPVGRLKSL